MSHTQIVLAASYNKHVGISLVFILFSPATQKVQAA